MPVYTNQVNAVIANGGSLSPAVELGGRWSLVGIKYPSAWTPAVLTFQVSFDGSTYDTLLDDAGNAISKTVSADQYRELDSSEFKSAVFIKLRSGTAAAPVAQLAERTFTLSKRRYI